MRPCQLMADANLNPASVPDIVGNENARKPKGSIRIQAKGFFAAILFPCGVHSSDDKMCPSARPVSKNLSANNKCVPGYASRAARKISHKRRGQVREALAEAGKSNGDSY
jgi:hypothetical protein